MSKTLERKIRQYIAEGSGVLVPVVKEGFYRGPIPDDVYATVQLIIDIPEGTPAEVIRVADGAQYLDVGVFHRATYDVQWHRDGAVAAAEQFVAWGGTRLGQYFALSRGFTPVRSGQIRRIDAIVSSEWEERVSLDLEVTYWDERRYEVGCIDTIEINVSQEAAQETFEVSTDA